MSTMEKLVIIELISICLSLVFQLNPFMRDSMSTIFIYINVGFISFIIGKGELYLPILKMVRFSKCQCHKIIDQTDGYG